MIDTVKFKISVTKTLLEKIKKRSIESKRYNHIDQKQEINYFQTSVVLPSYFRGINIFHSDLQDDFVFIEFSIPKLCYGHNLGLIDMEKTQLTIQNLYTRLTHEFGTFTRPEFWLVTRIDLCYAWFLPSYESAVSLLGQLRTFNYPRKKGLNYPTSIYAWGGESTVKIYLKGDEFKLHDYRPLHKINPTHAKQMYSLSRNILRFEVELRHLQLRKEFDVTESYLYNILKEEKIEKILKKYFNKFMNFRSTEIHSNLDIYTKLIKNSKSTTEAKNLFQFYKLLHSPIEEDRQFLFTTLHRTSVYRKKKRLKEIGIGIESPNPELSNFKFTIPSYNNPNNYLNPVDGSQEPRLRENPL